VYIFIYKYTFMYISSCLFLCIYDISLSYNQNRGVIKGGSPSKGSPGSGSGSSNASRSQPPSPMSLEPMASPLKLRSPYSTDSNDHSKEGEIPPPHIYTHGNQQTAPRVMIGTYLKYVFLCIVDRN
jgi:hypothetical protein